MKHVELKLIAELMKNSRRSDRDIARRLGVSQPTITRVRNKLEKEGLIKEYTVIPDFEKLGFEILAFTFVKLGRQLSSKEIENARKLAAQKLNENHGEIVMLERGNGLGYDGILASYHENYTEYLQLIDWLKQFDFLELDRIESFMVNLKDKTRYRPLSFVNLAKHLLSLQKTHEQR